MRMTLTPSRTAGTRAAAWLAAAALTCVAALAAPGPEVQVGDPAPAFSLVGSDGRTYTLAEFAGKKPVVIAWFPKAFTGGWTAECKSLRESGAEIRSFDVAYFAASVDTVDDNTKFAQSLELDFPILSDPGKAVAAAYGVVTAERQLAYRWTFYIGADGKVLAIDKKVNPSTAGKDLVAKLTELGLDRKK